MCFLVSPLLIKIAIVNSFLKSSHKFAKLNIERIPTILKILKSLNPRYKFIQLDPKSYFIDSKKKKNEPKKDSSTQPLPFLRGPPFDKFRRDPNGDRFLGRPRAVLQNLRRANVRA
jgi:hypothetical protein